MQAQCRFQVFGLRAHATSISSLLHALIFQRYRVHMQTPRSPGAASAASTPSAKDNESGRWHSPLASWRSSISSVSSSFAALSPRNIWGTSGIGVQLKKIGDNVAIKGLAPGGPAQVRFESPVEADNGGRPIRCTLGQLTQIGKRWTLHAAPHSSPTLLYLGSVHSSASLDKLLE